jgi:hypothetical protein
MFMPLDWTRVKSLAGGTIHTKTGSSFKVCGVTEGVVSVEIPSGVQTVSRVNLERAVELVESGGKIEGPSDYRSSIADERPAYAWAILSHLGYIN